MRTLGLLLLSATALLAVDQPQLTQAQIDDIIQKFAAKEAAFSQARENYTYRQTARVMSLDDAGRTTGKWEIGADILFTPEGRRTEHVVYAPMSTLEAFQLTPEDMEDLRSVQPFVLTTNELPKYLIRYLGKQQLDEINCYVFAVKPKKIDSNGQRYFEGEVWVDDHDLQIVKTYGRGVGHTKDAENNKFPKFETYREQIDGKYWFPTYTVANSTLHFKDNDQRMKETVRYENYKQFKAQSTITYGDEATDKDQKKDVKKPDKQ